MDLKWTLKWIQIAFSNRGLRNPATAAVVLREARPESFAFASAAGLGSCVLSGMFGDETRAS